MSKATTKATIDANIKQNGVQAITGQILNSVLNTMVDDYATQEKVDSLASKVNNIAKLVRSRCSLSISGTSVTIGAGYMYFLMADGRAIPYNHASSETFNLNYNEGVYYDITTMSLSQGDKSNLVNYIPLVLNELGNIVGELVTLYNNVSLPSSITSINSTIKSHCVYLRNRCNISVVGNTITIGAGYMYFFFMDGTYYAFNNSSYSTTLSTNETICFDTQNKSLTKLDATNAKRYIPLWGLENTGKFYGLLYELWNQNSLIPASINEVASGLADKVIVESPVVWNTTNILQASVINPTVTNLNNICYNGFIEAVPGGVAKLIYDRTIFNKGNFYWRLLEYNAEKVQVKDWGWNSNFTITLTRNTKYIKVGIGNLDVLVENFVTGSVIVDLSPSSYYPKAQSAENVNTLIKESNYNILFTPPTKDTPLIVGAHGSDPNLPNNSKYLYEMAAKQGILCFENDMRVAADGGIVLCHDNDLHEIALDADGNPFAAGTYLVDQMTIWQIKALKSGIARGGTTLLPGCENEHFLTIEEFFRLCRKYNAMAVCEFKSAFTAEQISGVYKTAKAYGMLDRIIWACYANRSFNATTLLSVANGRRCDIAYVDQVATNALMDQAAELLVNGNRVSVDCQSWNDTLVNYAHSKGLEISTWPIASTYYSNLLRWGVSFVTTNISNGTDIRKYAINGNVY